MTDFECRRFKNIFEPQLFLYNFLSMEWEQMVTQKNIVDFMQNNKDTPEIAEAAYLAAQYLSTEQIDRNLRLRHGSGQGFVHFKDSFTDVTEFESVISEYSRNGAQIKLETEEESTRLNGISVEDTDIDLQKVIKNSFNQSVALRLKEKVRERLPSLSYNTKVLAYIAIRGHDLGMWDDRNQPDNSTLWKFYSIVTGETPTDPIKTDIVEELVEAGCFYVNNDDIIMTPSFTEMEDPYEFLPSLEIKQPE